MTVKFLKNAVSRVSTYLQGLRRDVLFLRVCIALYGVPFAALGIFGLIHFLVEQPPFKWFLVLLLVALTSLGTFMSYAAFLGSTTLIECASEGISEDGEFIGILFFLVVIAIAVPITALLRVVQ